MFVCLLACLFKVGISTDKTVYLKRSYAKGKKKEKKEKKKSKKEKKEKKKSIILASAPLHTQDTEIGLGALV